MDNEYHPLALGTAKAKDSRFVRELPGERLSIIRVLMSPGEDPPERAISELPRGRGPRPDVYCPFCGRLGKYSHTDNYDHFSHISSEDECSPHDLETVLHRNAKHLLLNQFAHARVEKRFITAQILCTRCTQPYKKMLCKAASWDKEELERTLADGLRPDLTILNEDAPVFIVEVCVTHAVPADKDALLRLHGHIGVELTAQSLFSHTGEPTWTYEKDLPLPQNSWGLDASPRQLNICPSCRACKASTEAAAQLISAMSHHRPDDWRKVIEATGLPGKWRLALLSAPGEFVRNHAYLPEKLRDERNINPSNIAPEALHNKLFSGFQGHFGEAALVYWSSFEELASEPFKAIAKEAASLAADISGKTEHLSTSYGSRLTAIKLAEMAHNSAKHPDSHDRAQAWIGLALLRNSHRYGNTTMKRYTLNNWPGRMINGSSKKLFERWAKQLKDRGFIGILNIDGTEMIVLRELALKELNIFKELRDLRNKNKQRLHYTLQLRDQHLNAEQQAAIKAAAQHPITIIHGSAGTGKSRVIQGIVSSYKRLHWIILAPTGKAAERLRHVAVENKNCAAPITFAKLVSDKEIAANYPTTRQYGVILDEAGFVSVEGFDSLLKVLRKLNVARLILAGDPEQLPSIGPGWVFGDLIRWAKTNSGNFIAQTELTVIVRSNTELAIAANMVRAGHYPTTGNAVTIAAPGRDLDAEAVAIIRNLQHQVSEDVQVLGATRRIVHQLNLTLQARHNLVGKPLQSAPGLRIGDQVICTENYYGLEKLFNGQKATIESETEKEVVLSSSGATITLPIGEISRLDLGYALTIHKAQGSEWDSVVVLLPDSGSHFVNRPMIYTALTRSKKHVHFIATTETLTSAISRVIHRNTALYHFLNIGDWSPAASRRKHRAHITP